MIHKAEISIRHSFRNGNLRIMPAPDKAYNDHPKKMHTKIEPTKAGYNDPDSASSAMPSPAPEAKYQSGPPKIMAM